VRRVIITSLMQSENVERSILNHNRVDGDPNDNPYCECVIDYGL
jgi:hypothetical protein